MLERHRNLGAMRTMLANLSTAGLVAYGAVVTTRVGFTRPGYDMAIRVLLVEEREPNDSPARLAIIPNYLDA